MFPELAEILNEGYELAFEALQTTEAERAGTVVSGPVVTRYRDSLQNLRTTFQKIVKRAGLTAWPKLFQNLRSTRETELAESFPLQAVTSWLGNSQLVAAEHYLQLRDEHFERAAAVAPPVAPPVAPQVSATEGSRVEETKSPCENLNVFAGASESASDCVDVEWAMRDSNPRLHPCKGCTLAN